MKPFSIYISLLLLSCLANAQIGVTNVSVTPDYTTMTVSISITCNYTPTNVWVVGGLINSTASAISLAAIDTILGTQTTVVNTITWNFYLTNSAPPESSTVNLTVTGIKNAGEQYYLFAYCGDSTSSSNSTQFAQNWNQPSNGGFDYGLDLTFNSQLSTSKLNQIAVILAQYYNQWPNLVYDENGNSAAGTPSSYSFVSVDNVYSFYFGRNYSITIDNNGTNVSTSVSTTNLPTTLAALKQLLTSISALQSIAGRTITPVTPILKSKVNTQTVSAITLELDNLNVNSRIAVVGDVISSASNYTNVANIFNGLNDLGVPAPLSLATFLRIGNQIIVPAFAQTTNPGVKYNFWIVAISEGSPIDTASISTINNDVKSASTQINITSVQASLAAYPTATITVTCNTQPDIVYVAGGLVSDASFKNIGIQDITNALGTTQTSLVDNTTWRFYGAVKTGISGSSTTFTISGIKNAGQDYTSIAFCGFNNLFSSGLSSNSWTQPSNGGFDFRLDLIFSAPLPAVNQTQLASIIAQYYTIQKSLVYDENGNNATGTTSSVVFIPSDNISSIYFGRDYAATADNNGANVNNSLNLTNKAQTLKSLQNVINNGFSAQLQDISGTNITATAPILTPVLQGITTSSIAFNISNLNVNSRIAVLGDLALSKANYTNVSNLFQGQNDAGQQAPLYFTTFLRAQQQPFTYILPTFPQAITLGKVYNFYFVALSEGSPIDDALASTIDQSQKNLRTAMGINNVTASLAYPTVNVSVNCSYQPDIIYVYGALVPNFNSQISIQNITTALGTQLSFVDKSWNFYGIVNTSITSNIVNFSISGIKNSGEVYVAAAFCGVAGQNSGLLASNNWTQPSNGGFDYALDLVFNDSLSASNQTKLASLLAQYYLASPNFVYDENGNNAYAPVSLGEMSVSLGEMLRVNTGNTYSTYFGRNYAAQSDVQSNVNISVNSSNVETTFIALTKLLTGQVSPGQLQSVTGRQITSTSPTFTASNITSVSTITLQLNNLNVNSRVTVVGDLVTSTSTSTYTNFQNLFQGLNDLGVAAPLSVVNTFLRANQSSLVLPAFSQSLISGAKYNFYVAAISEGSPVDALPSSINSQVKSIATQISITTVGAALTPYPTVTVTVTCNYQPDFVYVAGGLLSDVNFSNQSVSDIQAALGNQNSAVNILNWRFFGLVNTSITSNIVNFQISGIKNSGENYIAMAVCVANGYITNNITSNNWTQPDNNGTESSIILTYNQSYNTTKQAKALVKYFNVTQSNLVYDQEGNAINPSVQIIESVESLSEQVEQRRILSKAVGDSNTNFTYVTYFGRDYSLAVDNFNTNITESFSQANLNATLALLTPFLTGGSTPLAATASGIVNAAPLLNVSLVTNNQGFILNINCTNTNGQVKFVADVSDTVDANHFLPQNYSNYTAIGVFNNLNASNVRTTNLTGSGYCFTGGVNLTIAVNKTSTNAQNYSFHVAALSGGIPANQLYSSVYNLSQVSSTSGGNFGTNMEVGILGLIVMIVIASLLN
jgi:hypothetical protein